MTYEVLAGMRVIDLGIITAGAGTSAILADLGAEVIKIEGPSYIDPFRHWDGAGREEGWWNHSPQFRFTNRNKSSCCIDLKSDEGRSVLLDMVARSDVVVENFRVGALEGLGLGYDRLKAVKPDIVLASISSQGRSGPYARSVSFGSTLEGSSGLASLIRSGDGTPQISGHALNYPDQVVSLFAAGAILAALINRGLTGEGAALDISQRELSAFMIGERIGAAPGGGPAVLEVLASSRDGLWVAATVETPARARAVGDAIGLPGSPDAAELSRWIGGVEARQAVALLEAHRCPAAIARKAEDLLDPDGPVPAGHAFARDISGARVKGCPWVIGGRPLARTTPAPDLGQHNETAALEIAGLSPARFTALRAQGAFATTPRAAARGEEGAADARRRRG